MGILTASASCFVNFATSIPFILTLDNILELGKFDESIPNKLEKLKPIIDIVNPYLEYIKYRINHCKKNVVNIDDLKKSLMVKVQSFMLHHLQF